MFLEKLNKYFKTNININKNNTNISIFNDFLDIYITKKPIEYTDKVCIIENKNNKYYYTIYYKNEIISKEIAITSRKTLNKINKIYELKISNIILPLDNIVYYPLIKNYLFGNDTHYISKSLPFSINNKLIFLTNKFYNFYINHKRFFNYLYYCTSMILNIEQGIILENIKYTPKINIVNMGRWYYSCDFNIHNNLNNRKEIENILNNNGYYLNMDIVSAVPYIFSILTNSNKIKELNQCRLNNMEDKELKDSIKTLTNIYIFSNYSYDKLKEYYKNKINFSLIKKKLNIPSFSTFFNELQNEIFIYDQNIINKYNKNLNNKELNRFICLPEILFTNNKDFIKKHRTYINGHVNDLINRISYNIYKKYSIFPIYTIYDNLMYFSTNKNIISNIYSYLTNLKVHVKIQSNV